MNPSVSALISMNSLKRTRQTCRMIHDQEVNYFVFQNGGILYLLADCKQVNNVAGRAAPNARLAQRIRTQGGNQHFYQTSIH